MSYLGSNKKVVLVTGAANGIGLATARKLAISGCDLFILDKDAEPLAKAVTELTSLGAKTQSLVLDLSDSESIMPSLDEALGDTKVDQLVNNAGVAGLTRAICADHAAEGIRINAIAPGTVDSTWIAKILADAPDPVATRKMMEARQLDGKMGTPEEVANGIAFLLSPEGRFINGSLFVMDAGLTAV